MFDPLKTMQEKPWFSMNFEELAHKNALKEQMRFESLLPAMLFFFSFKDCLVSPRKLGKIPIATDIFSTGKPPTSFRFLLFAESIEEIQKFNKGSTL